jgi:hypothetical protein
MNILQMLDKASKGKHCTYAARIWIRVSVTGGYGYRYGNTAFYRKI